MYHFFRKIQEKFFCSENFSPSFLSKGETLQLGETILEGVF